MKQCRLLIFVLLMLALVVVGCSSGGSTVEGTTSEGTTTTPDVNTPSKEAKAAILISAAASLTDALEELKGDFEAEHKHISLTYSFGSSGKLAQQIEQGAPAAVFLSASTKDMKTLQDKGLIVEDSRVDFTQNELVLIAPKDSALDFSSFTEIKANQLSHFAIGDPESVPVGRYTKEVLENIDLWSVLESKFVLGSDVRQVLTYVESGNAELGVVYSSDTLISDQVKILTAAEEAWHTPIVYPGAVIKDTEHKEAAQAFLDYLTSDKGKEVLAKYGFK